MSKKLIAVASAAALALTALVGIAPASANVTYIVANDNSGTGTSSSPFKQVSLDQTNLVQDTTALEVTVSADEGDTVSVVATGAIKLLKTVTTAEVDVATGAGTSTLSLVANANDVAVFYAYSTSTTVGTVSITHDGNTSKFSMASEVGVAYNLSGTVPSSMAVGATTVNVAMTVTDVYGNKVDNTNKSENNFTTGDITREDTGPVSAGDISWHSSSKTWRSTLSASASGPAAVTFELTAGTVYDDAPDAKTVIFGAINSASPDAQIAALTAQVAALTADYNTLAAKWNKKVKKKKNKVALK